MSWPKGRLVTLLTFATAAAAIVAALVLRSGARNPPPAAATPNGIDAPSGLSVFLGEDGVRVVLLRRRFAAPARAEFSDAALRGLLGPAAADRRFVELWVENRGPDPQDLSGLDPKVRTRDGRWQPLTELSALTDSARVGSPVLAALGAPESRSLGKESLRRIVYALPASTAYDDVDLAAAGGLELSPIATTEAHLESFVEHPSQDVRAVLLGSSGSPQTRATVTSENGR